jgi:hypothetical protein
MTKLPMVKWRSGQRYRVASHSMVEPMTLAAMRGAVLHFKLFDSILENCANAELLRAHYQDGREWRDLAAAIARAPDKSFFHPKFSVRYADTAQLVALGLMNAHTALEAEGIGRVHATEMPSGKR